MSETFDGWYDIRDGVIYFGEVALAKFEVPPGDNSFLLAIELNRMIRFANERQAELVNAQAGSATTASAPVTAKNPPAPTVEDPPKSPSQQGREAT